MNDENENKIPQDEKYIAELNDDKTLLVKLPYKNIFDFYSDMTPAREGDYVLEAKGIRLLKIFMFKNEYYLFKANKRLKGIKGKIISLSKPWEDSSKKREFIKQWIKEVKKNNNLVGDFNVGDFERVVNKGEILVSERIIDVE